MAGESNRRPDTMEDPMTSGPESLTMFFPCFNDAATIGSLVAAAHVVGTEAGRDFEILVVDDGSKDNSIEILEALREMYHELRVVYHGTNRGYGAALRSGFSEATKDLVFYTDGDGQYDVLELRRFLPVLQEGVDVVNGYKISRSDPLHRVVIGKVYVVLMRILFQFHVRDVDCDFRLIRRAALEAVTLKHSSGVICLELVKKLERAGFRFVDFPVHHYHRVAGKSQFFNFRRLFATGVNILRLWWEIQVTRDTPRDVAHLPSKGGVRDGWGTPEP